MADPSSISSVTSYPETINFVANTIATVASAQTKWPQGGRALEPLLQKLSNIHASLTQIEAWKNLDLPSSPFGEPLRHGLALAIDGCVGVLKTFDRALTSFLKDSAALQPHQPCFDPVLDEYDRRFQSFISAFELLRKAVHCRDLTEQNSLLSGGASQQSLKRILDDAQTFKEGEEPIEMEDTRGHWSSASPQGDNPVLARQQVDTPTDTGPTRPPPKKSRSSLMVSKMNPKNLLPPRSESSDSWLKSSLTDRLTRFRLPKTESTSRKQQAAQRSQKGMFHLGTLTETDTYLQPYESKPPPDTIVAAYGCDSTKMAYLIRQRVDIEQTHPATGRTALAVAAHCGHDCIVESLLKEGANTKTKDTFQFSPLHLAAANGHCKVIELLLSWEAEVDVRGPENKTPLWVACDYGQLDAIMTLSKHDATINFRDATLRTPLHSAASIGDDEVAQLLLQSGADVNAKDSRMRSPLHCACFSSRIGIIKVLLGNKADIEAEDETLMTPLGLTAKSGHRLVTDLLIKHKASTKTRSQGGLTPLHWASSQGHGEVVALLLKAPRTDINACDNNGRTPLHLAVMGDQAMDGYFGVIEKLLRAGADVEAECNNKFRALHYACDGSKTYEASLLLNHKAQLDPKTNLGETPLHLATKKESIALVQKLLEKGATVDSLDNEGVRPLVIACSKGNLELVHQFLDYGAELSVTLEPEHVADSPICVAASIGSAAIIRLLASHGASVRGLDSRGWQPLRHAVYMGHISAVGCLLDNGARSSDLGKLETLSLASHTTTEQTSRIMELLKEGLEQEQREHQHISNLACLASTGKYDGLSELGGQDIVRRKPLGTLVATPDLETSKTGRLGDTLEEMSRGCLGTGADSVQSFRSTSLDNSSLHTPYRVHSPNPAASPLQLLLRPLSTQPPDSVLCRPQSIPRSQSTPDPILDSQSTDMDREAANTSVPEYHEMP